MDILYIIIPAYNEEANLDETIKAWYPVVEKYNGDGNSRLVLIDDGSRDNTYRIMYEACHKMPLFCALRHPNKGHGPTLIEGYKYAIAQNADYIFQTDSDGQTDPAEFDKFWAQRHSYDAIIGNRSSRQDGQSRVFVEKIVCLMLRLVFGVKVPDANAPFRLMSSSSLEKYIHRLPDDYAIPNIMLTTYYAYYKDRLKFEEISFQPRHAGTTSINWKKIIKIGFNSLICFIKFRKEM